MNKSIQNFKVRNGVIFCVCLLAIYFASLRWCLSNNKIYGGEGPVVIHLSGNLRPKIGHIRHANFSNMPIEELLQTKILHRVVNGEKLTKEYIQSRRNEDVLFFNRIPKTGSEMIVLLLQWLQQDNNFKHHRLKNTVNRHLDFGEQLQLAAQIGELLQSSTERLTSFDRHVHFTNFTQIGLKMPLLINIVRDPVEKISSRFYYARVTPRPGGYTPPNYIKPKKLKYFSLEECLLDKGKECTYLDGHEYDLTIPYFCGHQSYCRELNNVAALLTAKRNAEQWYSAVGVLESLNATLAVLEHKLPRFFKGVTDLYFKELDGLHHNKNWQKPSEISQWVKDHLRNNLSMEYEFYYFIKHLLNEDYKTVMEKEGKL